MVFTAKRTPGTRSGATNPVHTATASSIVSATATNESTELDFIDIDNTCRMCLGSGVKLQSIFQVESGHQSSVCTLVKSIAKVEIQPDDGLPSTVCKDCVFVARRFHAQKLQWELNDQKLRHYKEKQKHCVFLVKAEDPIGTDAAASDGMSAEEYSDFDMDSESEDIFTTDTNENASGAADSVVLNSALAAKPTDFVLTGDQFSTMMDAIKSIQSHLVKHDKHFDDMAKQMKVATTDVRHIKMAMHKNGIIDPANITLPSYRCKAILPVTTYAELIAFEETLKTDREDVVAYLCSIGGGSPKKMLANLVGAVLSVELQMRVTWKGIKHHMGQTWLKDPLHCRKTPDLVIEVIQGTYPRVTREQGITYLRKYLMHSTDRAKKKLVAEHLKVN